MIDWLLQHSYVLGFNMKISTAAADRSLSLVSRCSPPFVVYAILPFTPLSLIHRRPQHHLPKPRQWPVSSPPATTLSLAMLINLNFNNEVRCSSVLFWVFKANTRFLKKRREQKMHVRPHSNGSYSQRGNSEGAETSSRLAKIRHIYLIHCNVPTMPNMCNCCKCSTMD